MIAPILEVDGVSLRFGGVKALMDVSFAVARGEILGLIGPNGAGKSSLLNCMVGYYQIQGGDIRINGSSIRGWRPHRVAAAGVGRTFQHVGHLQSFRVKDALLLGADAATDDERGVAPPDIIARLNLAMVLESPLADLDYGTQKLADLARVLMMRPRILLLDEPTSGVDEGVRTRLVDLFGLLRRDPDFTAIVVDHDPRFVAAVARRLVVMDQGTRIADGPTAEVLTDPLVIESFLGLRAPATALAPVR